MFALRSSLVPLLGLFTLLTGCFQGSGRLETRSFALDGFEAVEASRYVDVELVHGEAFTVEITADDNLFSELVVRREGDALVLGVSDAHPLYEGITFHAVVTMPTISGLHLSGGAHATLDGFDVPVIAIHGSGGSRVEGTLLAGDLSIELSGASTVGLDGSAETLTVDASGGSDAMLRDVASRAAAVWLSGTSYGTVAASERLDYHLSGSSHLDYVGDPELGQQETSGGSSATPR